MLHLGLIFSYLLIFSILFALARRDLREYILPDYLNAALALSFMSFHIFTYWSFLSPTDAIFGALTGGGLLYLIRVLAIRFYHADALGLGDVKLMAAAGLGLGQHYVLLALIAGSAIGVLHGLWMGYAEKRKTNRKVNMAQVNVPAGVGLTIGIAIVTVYGFGFEWLTMK